MADERVVIRIDIDSDTREITKVQAQLAALASQGEAVQRSFNKTDAEFTRMNRSSNRLTDAVSDTTDALLDHDNAHKLLSGGSGGGSIGRTNRGMDNSGRNARRTHREFRRMLYVIIAVGIEFAIVAASLSLVNAGFAIGRFAAKTYQAALAGAAVAVAGMTVALAGAAAAQREYQAAVFATTYKSLPNLGNGTQQAMSALRMLTADQRVAVFGFESLQQAFAGVSKSTEMTAPLKNALVGVGDFAVAAGGDIGKNFAAAGEFIGLLQKEGKLTESVLASASKVGPQFEKAVKDAQGAGITGAEGLLKALSSGQLAEQAGIGGALSAVNNTLIGQLKGFMSLARSEFADYGQMFLPQLKRTFIGLSHELTIGFSRIRAAIGPTMGGRMIDLLGRGADRLIEVFTRLFEDNLPKAGEIFRQIYNFLSRTYNFIRSIDDIFRPFQEGSRIINQTFGPPIIALLMHFVDAFKQLNRLAVENEDKFLKFGQALERTVNFISDLFDTVKELFVDNLDAITMVMNTLLTVAESVLSVVRGLAAAGRQLGPLGEGISVALGLAAISGFQSLGNMRRKRRGEKARPTLAGRAKNFFQNRPGAVSGAVGMGAMLPIAGNAPSWASSVGMMGNTASMFASNPKTAMRIVGASTAIPYLATALQSQTLFGGALTGGVGGAALGASIGSFFPGPGTAIGAGIGTVAGATIGGIRGAVSQFDMSPQAGLLAGIGSGAALGAGTGALIGSFTGPGALVTAAIGTAIGAIVGGITGIVSGIVNDRRQRDVVRKAFEKVGLEQARGMSATYLEEGLPGVEKSMRSIAQSTEDIDRIAESYRGLTLSERKAQAERAKMSGQITQEQYDVLTLRNMDTGINQLKENVATMQDEGLAAFQAVDRNLQNLSSTTGKTTDEMGKLAFKMGIDLTSNTLDLSEALNSLGIAIPKTTGEIFTSIRRLSLDAMGEILRPIIESEKLIQAMDQAAEEVRSAGGFSSRANMASFIQTVVTSTMSQVENPFTAIGSLEQSFLGPMARVFTDPTSSLYGMFDQLGGSAGEFQKELNRVIGAMRTSAITESGGIIATALSGMPGQDLIYQASDFTSLFQGLINNPNLPAGVGSQFAGSFTTQFADLLRDPAIRENFANASPTQRLALTDGLINTVITQLTGKGGAFENIVTPDMLRGTPVDVPGIGTFENPLAGIGAAVDAANQRLENERGKMREDIKEGFKQAFKETGGPAWFYEYPNWWTGERKDTTSPRRQGIGDTTSSRLGRTLARHSYLDGMLPGKRNITSAWRNNNLGSLNSDHLAGSAYDLVGQNLVGYATAVRAGGGFAEFHGSGDGRHLHVVPGATPYGDAVSPMGSMVATSSGSYSANYSIVVNASPNQDVSAIANEVMIRIEDKERQMRERS